jgi:hypothetical protein
MFLQFLSPQVKKMPNEYITIKIQQKNKTYLDC